MDFQKKLQTNLVLNQQGDTLTRATWQNLSWVCKCIDITQPNLTFFIGIRYSLFVLMQISSRVLYVSFLIMPI